MNNLKKNDNVFPRKLCSGGQSGADAGFLDASLLLGVEHGGWCPRGRRSENGRIPDKYQLVETDSSNYLERTLKNVLDSDATVIFTKAGQHSPGSLRTIQYCIAYGKPWLHLTNFPNEAADAAAMFEWLKKAKPRTLNGAGSRESSVPGLHDHVHNVIVRVHQLINGSPKRSQPHL